MAGIPEIKQKRFYHSIWFPDLLGIGSAIVAGVPTLAIALPAITHATDKSRTELTLAWTGVAGVGFLILIGIVKVIQGYRKDSQEKDEYQFDGLRAALHVIHSLVRHKCNFPIKDRDKLRVAIYRVVNPVDEDASPEHLEQLLDYVGGKGGGAGRRFSIRSGITGRAVREKDAFAATRTNDDHGAFVKELVKQWSYTEEDAKKLSFDRNSWMAVPILTSNQEVTGVVYLDSDAKDFFKEEVRNEVIWACGGVATFINERYK